MPSESEARKQAELRQWNDRIDFLKKLGLMREFTEPIVQLIQEKQAAIEKQEQETVQQAEAMQVDAIKPPVQPQIPEMPIKAARVGAEDAPVAPPVQDSMDAFINDLASLELSQPKSQSIQSPRPIDQQNQVAVSAPVEPSPDLAIQPTATVTPLADATIPRAAASGSDTPVQLPQPQQQGQPAEDLESRRAESRQQQAEIPRLSESMIERFKRLQAQSIPSGSSFDKQGRGVRSNAINNGTNDMVQRSQNDLAADMEIANAQLGQLLERMARMFVRLARDVQDANRILDEAQY